MKKGPVVDERNDGLLNVLMFLLLIVERFLGLNVI